MCHSCEPSSGQLAQWLMSAMKVQPLPQRAKIAITAVDSDSIRVFSGGPIITMANREFSEVEAVVVKGDSVVFTGSHSDALKVSGVDPDSKANVDLGGKCLLPGFVEPHLHLILTALADKHMLKMSPLRISTLAEAIDFLKEAIETGKALEGGWLVGYGYDPSRVASHPDLTLSVLDAISKEVKIYILNQSGHVAYANTAALTAAGVTAASVAGNPNFQTDANGNLTGVLFEQATSVVGKPIPPLDPAKLIGYCQDVLQGWISKGCTTVFDAGIGSVGITDISLMAAVPIAPLRYHGAIASTVLANLAPVIRQPPFHLGDVEVTSIKFWADGSTQGFTAAVNEPYINPPPEAAANGVKNYPDAASLAAAMAPWVESGFQMVVHSNGDAATDMALDAYEKVFNEYPDRNTNIMHRIEHFTVTEPSQHERAKALGLGVSHTIGHVNYWGLTFLNYVLGEPRAFNIHRLQSDIRAGLIWSLHSDSPVTDVNPLLYLKTAVTRELYPPGSGYLVGTGSDDQSEQVDLESALKAITIHPAMQMGVSDKVGSLEAGKMADMVILDKDPRKVKPEDLDTLKVEQTWIGGKQVHSV